MTTLLGASSLRFEANFFNLFNISIIVVVLQTTNPFQEMAIVSTFSKLLKLFALFVQFTRLSKFRHIIQTFFVIDCCLHSNALLGESERKFALNKYYSVRFVFLPIVTLMRCSSKFRYERNQDRLGQGLRKHLSLVFFLNQSLNHRVQN